MMPLQKSWSRFALAATLALVLPPAANALSLPDTESLDSYAGLAIVTVSRQWGPTPAATQSGTASDSPTFVMAWMGGDTDYAHAPMLGSGVPALAIDFGSLLAGSAPTNFGRHIFNLGLAPVALNIDDLHLAGPSLGDVAAVLALAKDADDLASWTASETRGIFTARYRLVLFTAPGGGASSGASELVDANVGPIVEVSSIPEPDLLALIGIGLACLAASYRRKVA